MLELASFYNSVTGLPERYIFTESYHVVFKGKTSTVSLSCETVEERAITDVVMNARFPNGYFHIY
jgi:hypothetical protein